MSSRHQAITLAVALALVTFTGVLGGVAAAREGGHGFGGHGGHEFGGEGHRGGEHFREGGDGHRFDRGRWDGGHWFHGDHFGHEGWWWVVGDDWYGYDAPIYPNPDPYVPSAAAPGYWYYCGSAGAYYPYVAACPEGWTPVAPR
jgi:hypothetical protein